MAISTAVDISAVASVVGIKTEFKDLRGGRVVFLPQHVAVIGQGATASTYSTTKRQVTSANEVGSLYGYGSPLHLSALQLKPNNGDGIGTIPMTIFPLADNVSGIAGVGTITPTGTATSTQSTQVRVGNIPSTLFAVTVGDTIAAICTNMAAAINANPNMPVTASASATVVTITSKWKGSSANGMATSVVSGNSGITFGVVDTTGGGLDPTIDAALAQFGNVWYSMVLSCLSGNPTAMTALSDTNEGRWAPLVRKPFVSFSGTNEASVNTALTIPDSRKTDRTNSQLVAPGSAELHFNVAARQLARIVKMANENPPTGYGKYGATGLTPGADAVQWTYDQRDQAVKGGSSTIVVKDGIIYPSDVVTFYHPTGESNPAYRYVDNIVRVQNILFNTDLIFEQVGWKDAPLIPDGDPTVNPLARKPKDAVAAIATMLDNLGLNAIISDPAAAKKTIVAAISDQNPRRLDVAFTVQLSGSTSIISIDFGFGFYFGTLPVIS